MPVDFKFRTEDGDITLRAMVDSSVSEHAFELASKPISMELDPEGWLLKEDVEYQFPLGSLRADAGEEGVTLTWKEPKMGWVSGYNIYRREASGGDYVRLNLEPVSGRSYLDTTFLPDVFYYWVITASDSLDPGYESLYSNAVSNYP